LLGVLMIGFTLGLKHALDSDHLAAVATMATGTASLRRALRHGAMWGLGHTITLLAVGGTVLVLGRVIPQVASDVLELIVGLVLVWLGVDVLWRVRRLHFHPHGHDGNPAHLHVHQHEQPGGSSTHVHAHPVVPPRRALVVGMVHGLAGSAALVLITVQAIASPLLGVVYMLIFGVGSMVGMSLVSMCVAVPLHLSKSRVFRTEWLMMAAAAASLFVGVRILFNAGAALGLV
jgi:sulfite exporter TauE/SafE